MRKLLTSVTLGLIVTTSSAQATELELFNETYTPTELNGLVVGNHPATLVPNQYVEFGTGPLREIIIQDSLSSANDFVGFDFVRFDFTFDFQLGFGTSDKDMFVGIHDGARHLSIFTNEATTAHVFGDVSSTRQQVEISVLACRTPLHPPRFAMSAWHRWVVFPSLAHPS